MNVLDANVVIGFLDGANANHEQAVALLGSRLGEPLGMHEVTIAEVLAGPAQLGRAAAQQVWAAIQELGVSPLDRVASPLDVALMRSSAGLPIPDCLVILSAGPVSDANPILTFDERLASKARQMGYTVLP